MSKGLVDRMPSLSDLRIGVGWTFACDLVPFHIFSDGVVLVRSEVTPDGIVCITRGSRTVQAVTYILPLTMNHPVATAACVVFSFAAEGCTIRFWRDQIGHPSSFVAASLLCWYQ